VAGDPSTGLAYIAPAKSIFEDIELQFDCRIRLSALGKIGSKVSSQRTPSIGANQQLMAQAYPSVAGGESDKAKGKIKVEGGGFNPALPREWEAEVPMERTSSLGQMKESMDFPERTAKTQSGTSRVGEPSTDNSSVSIPSNMATGSWQRTGSERNKERERDQRAAAASGKTNEFFVRKDDINRKAITADICCHFGNDALVRPRNYEASLRNHPDE
jgi:hypothetical protein